MKIAVLADIHGNLPAFEAVLENIEENNIDQIIVLGDMITDFPENTNIILDLMESRANHVIKGNREQYILDFDKGHNKYKQLLTLGETVNQITEKNLKYISTLPEQLSIIYDGNFSIRCVHGSPFSISEIISENDSEKNESILEKINEKILVCGHNHKQWYKRINDKTIISSGSVGINFNGNKTAQYVIIKYEHNKIDIELMEVEYDFESLKNKINYENQWTRLCISGIEKGENIPMQFLGELKGKTKEWPTPNTIWDEQFEEWYKNGKL